jgi:uncharacterized protein YbbC (DUF1343 family)
MLHPGVKRLALLPLLFACAQASVPSGRVGNGSAATAARSSDGAQAGASALLVPPAAVASSGASPVVAPNGALAPALQLGLDVLAAENFARLRGARVALLTNDTARASDGTRSLDVLAAAPGVSLVALFTPEHGQAANKDEAIADGVDERWSLPIYSLYGKQTTPNPKLLRDVDAVVVDLQDAGVRFYTYASTVHGMLRVAAKLGLRVLLLDRPNPLGAVTIAGPMLDPSEASFVNHHALPIRHGMTLGELAEMINADEQLGLALDVVRMRGYRRSAYFDETGLRWWPPSPNLRTVKQAVLYPAVALVEGTNVSVGRGTEHPFELMGAPWVDAERLLATVQSYGLAGVSFSPARFRPNASLHAGKDCSGLSLRVTDRVLFEPVRTGIALALSLRRLYRAQWQAARLHEIIGHPAVTQAILALRPLAEIEALYEDELEAFRKKRQKYLLYP